MPIMKKMNLINSLQPDKNDVIDNIRLHFFSTNIYNSKECNIS